LKLYQIILFNKIKYTLNNKLFIFGYLFIGYIAYLINRSLDYLLHIDIFKSINLINYNIIINILINAYLFINIFKGLREHNNNLLYDDVDKKILKAYPIKDNEYFISKFLINIFYKFFIIFIIFIIISPIFNFLNLTYYHVIILYVITVMFWDLNNLLSKFIYLIFNNIMLSDKILKKLVCLIFGFIIIAYSIINNDIIITREYYNIIYNMLTKNNISIYLDISIILFVYFLLFILTYYNVNQLRVINKTKYARTYDNNLNVILKYLKNKLINRPLLKIEIIKYARSLNSLSLGYILFEYISVPLIILFFPNYVNEFFDSYIITVFDKSLIYSILIVCIMHFFSPSITIFNDEKYNIWNIKSSNISLTEYIYNKYLFVTSLNIIYSAPVIILLLNNDFTYNYYIILYLIPIFIIHTSLGLLLNSFKAFSNKHIYIPNLIISIIHLSITIILIYMINAIYNINIIYLYMIIMVLMSVYYVKFIKPLIYYFLSIFINIYLYLLFSIVIYSIFVLVMLGLNLINANILYSIIHNINYVIAIITITLSIYKLSNHYIEKNIKNSKI